MNRIKSFLTRYGVTTHALAALWTSLVGLYFSDTGFRDAINQTALTAYHHMPAALVPIAKTAVAVVGPLWAWYRNGQRKTLVEVPVSPGQNATVVADVSATVSDTSSTPTQERKP